MSNTKEIIAKYQSHGKTFEFFVDSTKIEDYKQGKGDVVGFLVGKVQKNLEGKGDPKIILEMLEKGLQK